MKKLALALTLIVLAAGTAQAVDPEYLERLRNDVIIANKSLPVDMDEITVAEEIKLVQSEGHYYLATTAKIKTTRRSMEPGIFEYIREDAIKAGCAHANIRPHLNNGVRIWGIYYNPDGDRLGEFKYSVEDCK